MLAFVNIKMLSFSFRATVGSSGSQLWPTGHGLLTTVLDVKWSVLEFKAHTERWHSSYTEFLRQVSKTRVVIWNGSFD